MKGWEGLALGSLPGISVLSCGRYLPTTDIQSLSRSAPARVHSFRGANSWLARWLNENWALEPDCVPSPASCNRGAMQFRRKMVPLEILLRLPAVTNCPRITYPLTSICKVLDRQTRGQILTYPFPLGNCKALNESVTFGIPPQEGRPGRDTYEGLHRNLWSNRDQGCNWDWQGGGV